MPNPYPNATYPTGWDEANMVKSGDAAVNETGTGLVVSDVAAGKGPLLDMDAVTTADVDGTSLHSDNVHPVEETIGDLVSDE